MTLFNSFGVRVKLIVAAVVFRLPPLQGVGEFLGRNARHSERAAQRAQGDFPMHGDDTAARALGGVSFKDDMAAALPVHEKSEPLQRLNRLRT
jgi:hypothetical protein